MKDNDEFDFVEIDEYFEIDHTGIQPLEMTYNTLTYDFEFEYEFVPYYEYE